MSTTVEPGVYRLPQDRADHCSKLKVAAAFAKPEAPRRGERPHAATKYPCGSEQGLPLAPMLTDAPANPVFLFRSTPVGED